MRESDGVKSFVHGFLWFEITGSLVKKNTVKYVKFQVPFTSTKRINIKNIMEGIDMFIFIYI